MTDPGNGEEPAIIGASAAESSVKGANGAADDGRAPDGQAIATESAMVGSIGGEAKQGDGSSHCNRSVSTRTQENHANRRKRKRRRHRAHAAEGAADARQSPAAPETAGTAGTGLRPPAEHNPGKSHRKKHRALQGRPLCSSDRPGSHVSARSVHASEHGGAPTQSHHNRDSREEDRPFGAGRDGKPGGPCGWRPNGASEFSGGAGPGAASWPPPLYAALDLGTNNCRLLVAQPTRPGQFRVVDAFSRIVRLGEGLGGSGRLADQAMDRAVDALAVCAGKLAARPIRNRRLIATEACRRAANGLEFLARVRAETGLELEIVDRKEEARLAVSGCSSLVERDARSVVLFDIGGGSSEIAVIGIGAHRSHRLASHIKAWTSLPVGVVTLSEQHGGREVTRETFAAMVRDVEALLAGFDCPVGLTGHDGGSAAGFHLLGTSGTVTTLAGVYLDLPRYDRRRVDGLWLTNGDVDRMVERLLSWDFSQRSANPCIGPDRADLVLAGCAILEAIRRRWPTERMRVADRGLREGLLTEMMAADGIWRRSRRYRRPLRRGPPDTG